MVTDADKFRRSIHACLDHSKKLLEDAEWWINRPSTGLALAMLAQEECAKAFVLTLVRDEILPWTDEVRRSLSIHECKNLVAMIMEWLSTVNELRLGEALSRTEREWDVRYLPPEVATAMNIYRHEIIERVGRRSPERYPEWRGRARRVAEGLRDRKKQAALYVRIREDGDVASEPSASSEALSEELNRAKALIEITESVDRKCVFASREYELFAGIFTDMFRDLRSDLKDGASQKEEIWAGIPGVRFVKKTITCANVVPTTQDSAKNPTMATPKLGSQ